MLALMRYGAGLPMYRTSKWQNHFGVPLPASTQWELIEAASETPQVIYQALIGVAAQGQVLFNDDTHMRVQSVRREIAEAGSEQERTGIFTTRIISKAGQRQIAFFFTGQKHAGENLNPLLQRRAAGLDQPMQMWMLRAVSAPDRVHVLHPEVVGVSADGVNGLLEADLDFEALMATSELCREITLSDLQRPAFPSVLRLQVKGNPA